MAKMTEAEWFDVSRKDESHSQQKVSDGTHRKAAFNALRMGYYAQQAELPNVAPGYEAQVVQEWVDFYKPRSPAALAMIKRCVRATINYDRITEAHNAITDDQLMEADARLDRRRRKQVAGHLQWLPTQSERAAQALRSTSLGCRTLIARLEAIGDRVDQVGHLEEGELEGLVNMFGSSTQLETLAEVPYCLVLFNMHAMPADVAGEVARQVARLTRPERRPAVFKGKEMEYPVLVRELAQDRLRTLIDDEIEQLIGLEQQLRTGKERAERERILNPCHMIQDPDEARRYFQYSADTRSTFHRAYGELLATLARDAAAAAEQGPGTAGAGGEVKFGNETGAAPEVKGSQEVGTSVVDTGTLSRAPRQAAPTPARPAPAGDVPGPRPTEVPQAGVPAVARGPGCVSEPGKY